MTRQLVALLGRMRSTSEWALPVVMAAVLGALIVPLPAWLLDAGIALNLAASVALLVVALQARDVLQVTSFPTLLLVTTLFRLSLNVSSTRLALAEAHAGRIIAAFGEFVVRGDYLVGAVIFAVVTLVQFLVVAKGAERVSEVAARFTLDAMPGKQMSIDADLRAGGIDQAQARERRRELERTSQMFGAMDGAMKFVKGDVLAGLVIVLVNLLGGLLVGTVQNGMELSEAAAIYALIAIGDGLVSQIPSLCIAVAAGLVVTRVAPEEDGRSLGAEIGAQFFGHARPLVIVACLCLAVALIPGMPAATFGILAAVLGAAAVGLRGVAAQRREAAKQNAAAGEMPAAVSSEPTPATGVFPLTLDLGPGWTPLAQDASPAGLRNGLKVLRERLADELGIRIHGVRMRTGVGGLPDGGYLLRIDDVPAGIGTLVPGARYAEAAPEELAYLNLDAAAARHPGTQAAWAQLPAGTTDRVELAHVRTASAVELMVEHLVLVIRHHAAALLGVQDVQALLDALEVHAPALVRAAVDKVPLPLLTDVLRRLLEEEVSIQNLRGILESLVAPTTEGDAAALAERCRQGLCRWITHTHAPTGALYAYLCDPAVEEVLREGARQNAFEPAVVQTLLEAVGRIAESGRAVLLAAPDVRLALRRLCAGAFPGVTVLTYAELEPSLRVSPVGRVALG